MSTQTNKRLCFVVEAMTDVRMVEGMADNFRLTVLGRGADATEIVNRAVALPMEIDTFAGGRLSFMRHALKTLKRRRSDFDCVIVQGYGTAALAANLAARTTRVPTYMLVCSPVELYYKCRKSSGSADRPFKSSEMAAISAIGRMNARMGSARYLVLSRHLGDVVAGHGGARRPTSVVPIYGVDAGTFKPSSAPREALKARLNLPETGSLLFFSSRIAPEKDSETLLEACKILHEKGEDVWLLNRSGGYKTILREAERLSIQSRVIAEDAVHPQKELPAFYQAADLCVQASREEGLGFSPLEALACGTPVVATGVGGLKETIVDGMTGWTYPVGDAGALAERIMSALEDPAEAARRVANGRDLVCKEYETTVAFKKLREAVGA